MHGPVNLATAWSVAIAVLAALPALATAQDSRETLSKKAAERRWIPAFAIKSGVLFQNQESSVDSTCAAGGFGDGLTQSNCSGHREGFPVSDTPIDTAPLRPPDDSDMWAVSPYVAANVQLTSPALFRDYPVRLFVSGEMVANFATSRDIATEGEAGVLTVPDNVQRDSNGDPILSSFPAKAYLGVGSRTTSELQTLSWGADLGLSFPVHFQGRELRIKPSAGWFRFGMDIDGLVVAGIKDDLKLGTPLVDQIPPLPCTALNCPGSNSREVSMSAETSETWNAIGPGLEVELDTGTFGAVGATVFAGVHFYHVLGDRKIKLSESFGPVGGFAVDGVRRDAYNANWEFEMDPWLYRAGVGIRFHWLGF